MSLSITRHAAAMASFCALVCSLSAHAIKPRRMGRQIHSRISREPGSLITGVPAYKFNTILGLTICDGSALATGFQFGAAPFSDHPFYVGPEINFSLFSPGSVLGVLAVAWYELGLTRDKKLTLIEGFAGGAGFTTQLPTLSTTTSMLFVETTLSQEVDDLFSVRGQIRPGFIGKSFALMTSFSVSFRFY